MYGTSPLQVKHQHGTVLIVGVLEKYHGYINITVLPGILFHVCGEHTHIPLYIHTHRQYDLNESMKETEKCMLSIKDTAPRNSHPI